MYDVQSLFQTLKLSSQFTVHHGLLRAIQFELTYNWLLMAKSGFKGYAIWVTYFHLYPTFSCTFSLKEKSFKVRISGARLTSRGNPLVEKAV